MTGQQHRPGKHRQPGEPGEPRQPGEPRLTGKARLREQRRPSLLRDAPRFRYLWLSRTISFTGMGVSRVALVLLAAPSGPGMVSLVLLASALPQLLGPLAGAIADRVDQRRLLAGCEAGQGVIFALLAATRPPVAALLPMVAVAGLLAALMSPAGKGSVPRLVPASGLPRANAMLGMAINLQVVAGPAIGGVLVAAAGPSLAFAVNAASFFLSAALLTRLGPLPPSPAGQPSGLLTQTWAGLAYAARSVILRGLALGTLVFVSFAAIDNVALVFLVERRLHGSAASYGACTAAFGAGMMVASLVLAVVANRRPPAHWLIAGAIAGAAGMVGTGLAPAIALAALAQAAAGAGNTADLVGIDTMIQQSVPAPLLGRAFGVVYAAAQLASAIAYAIAGALVALTGPRVAFWVAGAGMLSGLLVLAPALRGHRVSPQVASG